VSRLPIRVRLTLGFALAMAVVLSAVGVFVYQRVGNGLLASVDQTLAGQSKDELSHERTDADAGGGATLAQILTSNGSVVHAEPRQLPHLLSNAALATVLSGQRLLVDEHVPGRPGEWRVLAVRGPSRATVAVVARSLEPRAESLDHLRHELVIFLSLALVAASLGGYALAAGALRPVETMRRRAETITAGEAATLPLPPARDEISRLAITLNDMLARLQAAVEHERRFVADASHELRTPLALLRTELDLALRRPRTHDELTVALRSAAEETERLSRLAEELLLIARSDQGPLPLRREPIDATVLLHSVAERFTGRAHALGRELHVDPATARLDVDPLRVEQALSNLVDNALSYGDGTIELAAEADGDLVRLHVRDSGAGFPPEFRDRAFDRFSRVDPARGHGGAGLGLAIVDLIARAHGGSVGLGDRPGGGADVWLTLARASGLTPLSSDEAAMEECAAAESMETSV
jgi:two-component system, OmpR family, sensor kinase